MRCTTEGCKFSAMAGREGCATHLAQQGDAEAKEELRRRQGAGLARRATNKAVKKRARVPLSTATEIRQFLEVMAAQAEAAGGDVLARVNAAVKAATCAAALLERELEKNAAALRELIEAHPVEARKLGIVP